MTQTTTKTPEEVLALANAEPVPAPTSRSVCFPYLESVHVLRGKNWSWRDIELWLEENAGFKLDRKQLLIHYMKWTKINNVEPYGKHKG